MYEVESIINKRTNPLTKLTEYEVKWAGYSLEETTWEPERNLIFVRNLIERFNERSALSGELTREPNSPQKNAVLGVEAEIPKAKKPDNIYSSKKLDSEDEGEQMSKNYSLYEESSQNIKQAISLEQPKSQRMTKNIKEPLSAMPQSKGRQPMEQKRPMTPRQLLQKLLRSKKIAKKEKTTKCEPKPSNKEVKQQQGYQKQIAEKSKQTNPSTQRNFPTQQFPPYQKRNENNKYSAVSKRDKECYAIPIRYKEHQDHQIQWKGTDRAVYSGYDSSFQSFPSPHNLPKGSIINNSKTYKVTRPYCYEPGESQIHHTSTFEADEHFMGPRSYTGNYNNGDVVVYQILRMEKDKKGFCYLAQTSQGELWLQRNEIVPRFSTELCEFYEKNLSFDD